MKRFEIALEIFFTIKTEEFIGLFVQFFTTEIVVICKIPAVLNNVQANKNRDLFNEHIDCIYGSKSGYKLLKLNTMMKSSNNWSFLYWDKTHLNDKHVVPYYTIATNHLYTKTPIIYSTQKV